MLGEIPSEVKASFAGFYLSHGLLSKDIAHRLAKFPIREIEKIERVWLAVEDALLLSSPEAFVTGECQFVKTLFRWVVSKLVVSGYESFLKDYKCLMVFLKAKAVKAIGVDPKGPPHFPGFSQSGEYTGIGLTWLDRVIKRGLMSKGEGTRLAHFISTRGLPPPTKDMIEGALAKHRATLLSHPDPVPKERIEVVLRLSRRIGKRINRSRAQHLLENPEHVSITNSSSFAYSRSDGGRAAEIQHEFNQWAERIVDHERFHVLGHHIPAGKNWLTCVSEPRDINLEGKNFGDPIQGGLLGNPRAGYDSNLGFQILQCAAEAGIERGILDERYNVIGHPYVRATVSSEPGGKARIVTANEWWVTILLQPLGHVLTSLLMEIPSARAGLSRAEPAWEWVEDLRLSGKDPLSVDELYSSMPILTSDLSEATDHCNRDISRAMLEGFLEGAGLEPRMGYLSTSIELLVGRKFLVPS